MNSNLSVVKNSWALLHNSERRISYFLMGLMFFAMLLETMGVGMVIPALALLTQDKDGSKYEFLNSFSLLLGNPSHGTLIIIGMIILMVVYLIKGIFLAYLVWQQSQFALSSASSYLNGSIIPIDGGRTAW